MLKAINVKQILSMMLVCTLALSLILIPQGVAQGVELDHDLYKDEDVEAEENDASELAYIEIDPHAEAELIDNGATISTVGQGAPTIFGRMPERIATPLRNQILSIWVGSSSSIADSNPNATQWELVWPIPYNPANNPPSTANPPGNITAHLDLEYATHIAFRFSNRIHQTATFRFNEIVQTRINQPGLLMTESYTSSGFVTPTGGVGMAFVSNAVFPLPTNIDTNPTFTLRLSFQQNNPPFLENQSYNITVLTGPREASTSAELQNAINAAPVNTETTIYITDDFSMGNAIQIPSNRRITLTSSNTSERVISQMTENQRHFIVFGRLTLGQNITLSGGLGGYEFSLAQGAPDVQENDDLMLSRSMPETRNRNVESGAARMEEALAQSERARQGTSSRSAVVAGGVGVGAGGTFTMNAGSIIEDCMSPFGGAVEAWGSGTAVGTRATFNLNGGMIRNNIALYGGAVDLDGNARMNMTSGIISGNEVFENGGGIWVCAGTTASGRGFNMTGGSIVNNFALGFGGGIFTTHFATGYWNIFTSTSTVFTGNFANAGLVMPPPIANRPAHVRSATASALGYILNNWDIVYLGHLG